MIERTPGGEIACVYRDRLMANTKRRAVYMLRLDQLPPEQQQFWLSKGCTELLHVYHWLRAEGTLPPQNLERLRMPNLPDEARKGGELATQIEPLLAGKGAQVQGVALATLLSPIWLAGHRVRGDPAAQLQMREELLELHIETVRELVQFADAEIDQNDR